MPLTRRELLKGIGVTAGVFGLGAGYPNLIPFINQPDEVIPGVSAWYATSCRECPAGCGIVFRNREARVVKAEGNPIHPINRGTLCARGQASLQALYDPDRFRGPVSRGRDGELQNSDWDDVLRQAGERIRGKRIALISDLQAGSLDALMRAWAGALSGARYVVYEPINYESIKTAMGGVVPSFNIAASDYLISFAADFLETWISPVEYARQFARMRTLRNDRRGRFVYVGPRVSMTAANADERIIVPPGYEAAVAYAIASEAGVGGAPAGYSIDEVSSKLKIDAEALKRVARGFAEASAPLALPGLDEASVRAAVLLNGGGTLVNTGRPHAVTNIASNKVFSKLIGDMENGEVDVLIINGANLAYSWVDPDRLTKALARVDTIISLSSFPDETSRHAHFILPSNTPYESWGDYTPQPGITNILQPVMGTMYNTRQTGDILISLAKAAGVDVAGTFGADNYYDFLRHRLGVPSGAAGDQAWESLVRRGGRWPAGAEGADDATPSTGYNSIGWQVSSAAVPAAPTPATPGSIPGTAPSPAPVAAPGPFEEPGSTIRLFAYPHIYLYDGRHANKRWMQELPEPVVQAAWVSWAELHPETAKRIGVGTDDLIEISAGDARVSVPVFVWEGVSPNTVAVPIGRGHTAYGQYAEGVGVNIWPLLSSANPEVKLSVPGGTRRVTRWKGDEEQHGRELARVMFLGDDPGHREVTMPLPEGFGKMDFYPGHEHASGNRWAMVIDLNKCIGCNACNVACYAENNIGVVGEEGIYRAREMAWIRVDRYIEWKNRTQPVLFQPMLCQHCDAAPCEPVCPVYAAVHSEDGLNEQIYNRCIGTRYCTNNCPWKVRKFNWFDYKWPEPMNYQLNPDVTVRSRGVMEKCTFCVQRIRQARIVAKREGRPLRDGEITPACVQTCPTGVFTFGDLMDESSRVSRIFREDPRAYQMLHELNTKPGIVYLKRIVERT